MRGATEAIPADYKGIWDFNPRTPCGVRLVKYCKNKKYVCISIHAPHAGCDLVLQAQDPGDRGFQSTHPMRGATAKFYNKYYTKLKHIMQIV